MGKNGTGCSRRPDLLFGVFAGLLTAAYSPVLIRLVRHSLQSDLESYIPLIPFISVYLLLRPRVARVPEGATASRFPAFLPGFLGGMLWICSGGLLAAQFISREGFEGAGGALLLPVLSFVTALVGGWVWFLGWPAFRNSWFPLVFLYFMAPIPEALAHGLRMALQHGSAGVSEALFWVTGTPVYREGLTFYLPGLTIQVAEECSGIHSSLVLFITSLVAGFLFLQKAWSRTLLALLVIPLGLLRNGIRVVTITLLSLHVDPGIIDGPLHHRGGPFFFILSMGMLVAILWGLRRSERQRRA
jgi:exosortase C (VPDSG-CTERM-specific)